MARSQIGSAWITSGSSWSDVAPGQWAARTITAGSVVIYRWRYEGGAAAFGSFSDGTAATWITGEAGSQPTVGYAVCLNHPGGTNLVGALTLASGQSRGFAFGFAEELSGGSAGLDTTPASVSGTSPTVNYTATGTGTAFAVTGYFSLSSLTPTSPASLESTTPNDHAYSAYWKRDHTGSGSFSMSATGGASTTVTQVIVLLDSAGGGDTTAPVLSSPAHSGVGSTSATVGATTDEGNGTAYVVVTLTSTAPTVAQIKAGQDAAGASVPAGRQRTVTISATGAFTFAALASLASSTQHWYHVVHADAAGNNSNVVTGTFTTAAANTPPNWTGTPSNMTAKRGQAFTAQDITSLVTDSDTLTYSLTGAPAGVTINSSSGIISGTANVAPGTFTCTVGANDGVNATVSSASFTITVTAASLNFGAAGIDVGGFVSGTVGSFAKDASVNYRWYVYAVAATIGSALHDSGVVATSGAAVPPTITDDDLVYGTQYRVIGIRQSDNELVHGYITAS